MLSCAVPIDLPSWYFFKSLSAQLHVRSPLTFFHVFFIPSICKCFYSVWNQCCISTWWNSGLSIIFLFLWRSVDFFSDFSLITELFGWHIAVLTFVLSFWLFNGFSLCFLMKTRKIKWKIGWSIDSTWGGSRSMKMVLKRKKFFYLEYSSQMPLNCHFF